MVIAANNHITGPREPFDWTPVELETGIPEPVSYWPGGGKWRWMDAMNRNHGTPYGVTPAGSPFGGAGYFGGDEYVDCGDSASLNITNAVTVSAWVYIDVSMDYPAVIQGLTADESDATYELYQGGDNTKLYFRIKSDEIDHDSVNTSDLNTKQWYHVAGVYNGSDDIIYLDGRFVDSKSADGAPRKTEGGVHIGRYTDYNDRYWNGKIDEVMIIPYALQPAQIRWLYQVGSLIAWSERRRQQREMLAMAGALGAISGVSARPRTQIIWM